MAFGESVRNMGLKLAAQGSAVAAPLLASTKVFFRMGDDLAKMSARTGFSVETLSELAFAANLSGAGMEDLEKSIRRMQATIVDAAQDFLRRQRSIGRTPVADTAAADPVAHGALSLVWPIVRGLRNPIRARSSAGVFSDSIAMRQASNPFPGLEDNPARYASRDAKGWLTRWGSPSGISASFAQVGSPSGLRLVPDAAVAVFFGQLSPGAA